MMNRGMYGHSNFDAFNLFSNVVNFNLESFFNIQLPTERFVKFNHSEKHNKIKIIFDE
jgi:hypothetical protein